ncbi:hypothetical protein [Bradyrhizobium diazoefficiens]
MQLIATRHYGDWIPSSGDTFELQDRLYRKPDNSFVLVVAGELPGAPPDELSCNLEEVFAWLQDCPNGR